MGVSPSEFWKMTPRELFIYAEGVTFKRDFELFWQARFSVGIVENIDRAFGGEALKQATEFYPPAEDTLFKEEG